MKRRMVEKKGESERYQRGTIYFCYLNYWHTIPTPTEIEMNQASALSERDILNNIQKWFNKAIRDNIFKYNTNIYE